MKQQTFLCAGCGAEVQTETAGHEGLCEACDEYFASQPVPRHEPINDGPFADIANLIIRRKP